jgi:trehalose 6-phosphate synthase
MTPAKGLIVVSNRLPVVLSRNEDGWGITTGAGGLVSAMAPVLRDRGGTWVGWTGASGEHEAESLLGEFSREAGYSLKPVRLEKEDVADFYYGFANEVIWPLFHDFQSLCNFFPKYWKSYLRVNELYARAVMDSGDLEAYVWVHDYHLMHVGEMLKSMGSRRRAGFFLHIPFPPMDNYLKLPWRRRLLSALLEYDLVGFQTYRDRRNFMQSVQVLLPHVKPQGRGPVIELLLDGRKVRLGAFPISIDYRSFVRTARSPAVSGRVNELKSAMDGRRMLLAVDRLDYSKGITFRLEAFREALEKYPGLRGNVTLMQIMVPSRQEVPRYNALKQEIERLVGEINGLFSRPGWNPVQYQYRSLGREELVAYYRAASMAIVTPLRDGMNLVAKEYCACNVNRRGVLLLSEFAGAAAQLQNGAVLVNPFDREGMAQSIKEALDMPAEEARRRMDRMRDVIRKNDIFRWVDMFLLAAFSRHLDDFPPTYARK